MANANSAVVLEEQDKRFALEQWLAASDQALSDEQTQQARLRDRLATADLRLSVLLDAIGSNGSGGVQATTGAGGVMVVSKRPIAGPQMYSPRPFRSSWESSPCNYVKGPTGTVLSQSEAG